MARTRTLGVALLALVAGAGAMPQAADAVTTCTFDGAVLSVTGNESTDASTVKVSGTAIVVSNPFNGVAASCTGIAPTVSNTDTIRFVNNGEFFPPRIDQSGG